VFLIPLHVQMEVAQQSTRKMLLLVWSKETAIADSVAEAYHTIFLAPLQAEESNEMCAITAQVLARVWLCHGWVQVFMQCEWVGLRAFMCHDRASVGVGVRVLMCSAGVHVFALILSLQMYACVCACVCL